MTEDETVRLGSITNSMDVDLSKVWESEGQRSLACCSPWNRKESDTTERLKNNNLSLWAPNKKRPVPSSDGKPRHGGYTGLCVLPRPG